MCHSADYKETHGAPKMAAYKPGQPIILENLAAKHKSDVLGNQDALYEQAMTCMTDPDRMGLHRVSEKSTQIIDLMEYLRNL